MYPLLLAKNDLATMSKHNLNTLFRYYEIPKMPFKDRLWALAVTIFNSLTIKKGTMDTGIRVVYADMPGPDQPRESDTAVFTFGRMNPPHAGHQKLVDKIMGLARANSADPYIFLSQSNDPKKNPLDYPTKIRFAEQFFPDVRIGPGEFNNRRMRTLFDVLKYLYAKGYKNIVGVFGDDRIPAFSKQINDYNGKPSKRTGKPIYTFENIEIVSAGERDPDSDDVSGMSASKMRKAVQEGDFEQFKMGTPDPELAEELYTEVRKGMNLEEPEPEPEPEISITVSAPPVKKARTI